MDELLLGRPLLKCIGFDIDKDMKKLCKVDVSRTLDEKKNNTDCKKKFASVKKYSGLWYNEGEPLGSVAEHMGTDTTQSIDEEIEKTVVKTKEAGMSASRLKAGRELFLEFRDTLRIKLGTDEPARVEPYSVIVKSNFRPNISAQRRFALPQREVI